MPQQQAVCPPVQDAKTTQEVLTAQLQAQHEQLQSQAQLCVFHHQEEMARELSSPISMLLIAILTAIVAVYLIRRSIEAGVRRNHDDNEAETARNESDNRAEIEIARATGRRSSEAE